jgi:hypothetical protein
LFFRLCEIRFCMTTCVRSCCSDHHSSPLPFSIDRSTLLFLLTELHPIKKQYSCLHNSILISLSLSPSLFFSYLFPASFHLLVLYLLLNAWNCLFVEITKLLYIIFMCLIFVLFLCIQWILIHFFKYWFRGSFLFYKCRIC